MKEDFIAKNIMRMRSGDTMPQVKQVNRTEVVKAKVRDEGEKKELNVKVEKALNDLSEHRSNYMKDKIEFDKQIEQAKQDKETRLRQTFYGQGPYGTNVVAAASPNGIPDPSTINSSNYYKPIGYSTGTSFRPSTQKGRGQKSAIKGEALTDGDILSNIDNISREELKERLIVSEIIMKKLYTRNKDLEKALEKASNKISELKPDTTQNFFQNTDKENESNSDDDSEGEVGYRESD